MEPFFAPGAFLTLYMHGLNLWTIMWDRNSLCPHFTGKEKSQRGEVTSSGGRSGARVYPGRLVSGLRSNHWSCHSSPRLSATLTSLLNPILKEQPEEKENNSDIQSNQGEPVWCKASREGCHGYVLDTWQRSHPVQLGEVGDIRIGAWGWIGFPWVEVGTWFRFAEVHGCMEPKRAWAPFKMTGAALKAVLSNGSLGLNPVLGRISP